MHPPCEVKNVVEVNQWIWTLDACTSKSRGQHQHVPTNFLPISDVWRRRLRRLWMLEMSAMSAFQPDSHSIALSMVPESEATNLDPGKLFRICVELGALRSFAELCGASLASSCTDSVCIFWTFWSWLEPLEPQSLGVGSDIDGATGCQRPVCQKLQRREAHCVFGAGFLRDSSWSGVFVTGVKLSDLTSGRTYPFGDTGLTVYSSPFSEAGNRECDFTYHFRWFALSFDLLCKSNFIFTCMTGAFWI